MTDTTTIARSTDFACDSADPYSLYRDLRRDAPVIEGDILRAFGAPSQVPPAPGRPVYSLFRHDDVRKVLMDGKTFQSSIIMEGLGSILGKFLLTGMDGETHRFHRGIVQPTFAPSVVDSWRSNIIDPVIRRDFVEPMAGLGRADLMPMALAFPISVIYAILGFPDERQASEQFAAMAQQVLRGALGGPGVGPEARAAGVKAAETLHTLILEVVARRRAAGAEGEDLMARLLRIEFEGRTLSDDEVTDFVRMMLPAASDTTSQTFAILMLLLLERPQLLARVRADRSLLPKALDEAIRFEPTSCYKARVAVQDVEFRGVTIPKGSAISACTASANRDEAVFENSEVFDIDRPARPNFGFGFGPHMCVGMFVAKAEILSAVNRILDLLPNLRLDPDHAPPTVTGVHSRGVKELHVLWD